MSIKHLSHSPAGLHTPRFRRHRSAPPARLEAPRAEPTPCGEPAAGAGPVSRGFLVGPVDWLKCLAARLSASRIFGAGAEMAFWLFLSLLPLAAVAGLLAARVTTRSGAAMSQLLGSLPRATRELLAQELTRVAAWNGGKVGVAAAVTFVWLASSGIHAVFDGVEIATEAVPRPWWRKRLLAMVACVGLSAGIGVLTLLGTGLGWIWHLVGGDTMFHALRVESTPFGHLARWLAGTAVSVALISGLYWAALAPPTRRTTRVLPGAVLAVLLQAVIGAAYGLYVSALGDGSAYQAGLASIGVTLMALYLFCLALLAGVEVNQMMSERRNARPANPPQSPASRPAPPAPQSPRLKPS